MSIPRTSHYSELALLGLGEAGAAIAADLAAAGTGVAAWDPAPREAPGGVREASRAGDAVRGAEAVLSVNGGSVAVRVAEAVAGELRAGALFADLNTAAPERKREIAAVVEGRGAAFADVALMAPVPGRGLRTPALASGSGAERFAALLGPLGMPVTTVGPEAGAAAARKLMRSVFMKGLATAAGEALAAAERLDCEPWLREDLERTLDGADGAMLARFIEGSRSHAERRVDEMAAAGAMLRELGVEPRIAAASEDWLRSLAAAGACAGAERSGARVLRPRAAGASR